MLHGDASLQTTNYSILWFGMILMIDLHPLVENVFYAVLFVYYEIENK